MGVILGKNGKAVVTHYRIYDHYDRKNKNEEIEKVVVLIDEYIKNGYTETLDYFIKKHTTLSYEDIYKDIQLLLLSGVLEVENRQNGEYKYSFSSEAIEEIKDLSLAKKSENQKKNKENSRSR